MKIMKELFEKWYQNYVVGKQIMSTNKDSMAVAFEAGWQAAIDEERKHTYHIKNYMENKP